MTSQKQTSPRSMTFTIPEAPSSNRYWRNVKGRMVLSSEARLYRKKVMACALFMRPVGRGSFDTINGDVAVTIQWFRSRKSGDLDNRIKQTLDALRGIAFTDDSQIVRLAAERYDDKKAPRMEITVSELPNF